MSLNSALSSVFPASELDLTATSKGQRSDFSPDKLKELTTSSETPAIDEIEDEDTVSTVEHSYIIKNNNIADDELADKVVIEAMVVKVRFQHSLSRGVNGSLDWTGMVRIYMSTHIYSLILLYF